MSHRSAPDLVQGTVRFTATSATSTQRSVSPRPGWGHFCTAQGIRGTDGGSDGSVLPLGDRSGDGDRFFHPAPSQGAVHQRPSPSLVQLAVTKPGRGRERVNTGRLLAGAAGSGSQLPAHARLLAALPGDRALPARICCSATRFVPLQPPLAASHQRPGPCQGKDIAARPRSC